MTNVHFIYQATLPPTDSQPEGPPITRWCIACSPGIMDFRMAPHHQIYVRTEEVRAVTCLMCKQTQIFKKMKDQAEALLRSNARA